MSAQTEVLALVKLLRPWRSSFRKVRIGSLGDGGYVLPDDLEGISSVLSIGIGGEVSFDLHFAEKGIPVYQYDPTVEGPPIQLEMFRFHKTAWGPQDNEGSASLGGKDKKHGLAASDKNVLKFDTEGAEWKSVINTVSNVFQHFRIIACELHGLNNLHNQQFMQEYRQTMNLLMRNHTVVHLHANNCCGITLVEGVPVPAVVELTLLRNDRSSFVPCHDSIPGPLDYPSMTDRPDLILNPLG